jgi:hypothetical protein
MVIDSGATSHFCSEDMNLPKEGESNKSVYLPNGNIIRTTKRISLPFQQLTKRAREAHVLPHLRQSLMSVNKLSEEGYTTIFHPKNEGVTIHKKGTLTITTNKPPVLQGCYLKQLSHSIYSANPMQFHQYPRTNMSKELLTTIKLHLDQWEAQFKCMKAETTEAHGPKDRSTDGISELCKNTTAAISFTSRKQIVKEYQTQFFSSTNILHNQHSHQLTQ